MLHLPKRQEWILEKPRKALFSCTEIHILSMQCHWIYYTRHGTRKNSFGSVIFTLLQSWHLDWLVSRAIDPPAPLPGFEGSAKCLFVSFFRDTVETFIGFPPRYSTMPNWRARASMGGFNIWPALPGIYIQFDIPSRFLTSWITGEVCLNHKASESQVIWIARIRICHDCAKKK